MKKLFSMVILMTLFLNICTSAYAAEKDDYTRGLKLIEKANKEIDKIIFKAVKEADVLHAKYILDIRKIEEGKGIVKLKQEQEKVILEIRNAKNEGKDVEWAQQKLVQINQKLEEEQAIINEQMSVIDQELKDLIAFALTDEGIEDKKLIEKIEGLTAKVNVNSEKIDEVTEKYTEKLTKIINDTYNETLKISTETINKAAQYGVIAECSWTLVRFADQWVWIDPIRIIGRQ